MKRREFIITSLALAAVPAVVPAVVKAAGTEPKPLILYGDGITDDTEAFQALINGDRVYWSTGEIASPKEMRGRIMISSEVRIPHNFTFEAVGIFTVVAPNGKDLDCRFPVLKCGDTLTIRRDPMSI